MEIYYKIENVEKFYYKIVDHDGKESVLCTDKDINPEAISRILRVKATKIEQEEFEQFKEEGKNA